VGTDGNITSQGSFTWSPAPTETNAGTYTMTATFTSTNPNYSNSGSGSAALAIARASVSPSVTAASKTYDGTTTATISACKLSGVIGSDAVTCTAEAAGFASANVANGITVTATGITLAGSAAGSYILSSTSATTTANITMATPTVTVTCPPGIAYDGNTHACTVTATGAGGATVNGTFSWSPAQSETNAGAYTLTATFTSGNINYNSGSPAGGSLVIAKATPAVTVTCPAGITYDGSAHACSGAATGVASDGNITSQGSFTWSPAQSETAAGSYTVAAAFTSTNSNYNNSGSGSASLTIGALVPTISTWTPAEQPANAAAFTLTVNGAYFLTGATVNWNGSPRTTTFVNSSQLTAAITSADLATVGMAGVTVTNPVVAGSASAGPFTFVIDTATGTAGAATVSATSQSVTVAPNSTTAFPVSFTGASANAQITANCVNLPSGVTCGAYNSSSNSVPITASASAAPGTYQITVIFTIVQQQTASGAHRRMFFAACSGLLGLPLGLLLIGEMRSKNLRRILGGLIALMLLAFMVGCGGVSSSSSPSPTSTASTVTSQSSVAVTLTVQ
jgi:hypothetical protein